MSFSEKALDINDQLLKLMMAKINKNHPLAGLLYEAAMSVREILCSWKISYLSHVAYEQLVERQYQTKLLLNGLSCNVQPPMESYLQKFSAAVGQGWQKRWFSIHNHHMTFHRVKGEAPHKALELHNFMEVTPQYCGTSEAEFTLNIKSKLYRFKAENDKLRCKWIEVLEHYQRRRVINAHIASATISDRLKLFTRDIFSHQIPREKQYLFSTSESNYPYPKKDNNPQAKLPFQVTIPAKFGKSKEAEIEFQFDKQPRVMMVTKQGDTVPYINLTFSNLLDFKITEGRLLFTLHLIQDRNKSSHIFSFKSESEYTRFQPLFMSLREFNHGFKFYHADVLSRFGHLSESQIHTRSGISSLPISPDIPSKKEVKNMIEKDNRYDSSDEYSLTMENNSYVGLSNDFLMNSSSESQIEKKLDGIPQVGGRNSPKSPPSRGSGLYSGSKPFPRSGNTTLTLSGSRSPRSSGASGGKELPRAPSPGGRGGRKLPQLPSPPHSPSLSGGRGLPPSGGRGLPPPRPSRGRGSPSSGARGLPPPRGRGRPPPSGRGLPPSEGKGLSGSGSGSRPPSIPKSLPSGLHSPKKVTSGNGPPPKVPQRSGRV